MLATKAVGMFVKIKDVKKDYIITKDLSNFAGGLALKCGQFIVLANVALITTKHIDFNAPVSRESQDGRDARDASHDVDGYPPMVLMKYQSSLSNVHQLLIIIKSLPGKAFCPKNELMLSSKFCRTISI